jgi:RNA polymerase sigma factor (sigma-70 family)
MQGEELAAAIEPLHESGFGWALACCRRDREMAQEVLQSAYLKILEGKARFDGRSTLKTWLFGVIRRTAAEHRRHAWLEAARSSLLRSGRGADAPLAAGPEASHAEAEKSIAVRAALAGLSTRQRQVLHLVFYEGLTVEESAGVLEISAGSARVHYDRGKERLRRLLSRGMAS